MSLYDSFCRYYSSKLPDGLVLDEAGWRPCRCRIHTWGGTSVNLSPYGGGSRGRRWFLSSRQRDLVLGVVFVRVRGGAQVERLAGDQPIGKLAQTVGGGVLDALGEEVEVRACDHQPHAQL